MCGPKLQGHVCRPKFVEWKLSADSQPVLEKQMPQIFPGHSHSLLVSVPLNKHSSLHQRFCLFVFFCILDFHLPNSTAYQYRVLFGVPLPNTNVVFTFWLTAHLQPGLPTVLKVSVVFEPKFKCLLGDRCLSSMLPWALSSLDKVHQTSEL